MSNNTSKSQLLRLGTTTAALCFGVVLLGIISGIILLQLNKHRLTEVQEVNQWFVVPQGASLNQIIKSLEQERVIDCALCLQMHLRVFGLGDSIKAGSYQFLGSLSALDIIDQMVEGEIAEFQITLVEGNTLDTWLQTLWAHPQIIKTIEGDDRTARYAAVAKALDIEKTNPEGLFLPETYAFVAQTKDIDILNHAYKLQKSFLKNAWSGRAQPSPIKTPYDALILASIVEKETGVPAERAEIAGVFMNRLNRGMRLETDPTVIYGIANYEGKITRAHLREETAYNTYRIAGLPPTPIAGASRASINAVLHPASTKAIFFVAKGDGSHVFSQTLEQHNAAVREYQLKRRADYRSTPKVTNPKVTNAEEPAQSEAQADPVVEQRSVPAQEQQAEPAQEKQSVPAASEATLPEEQ